MKIYLRKPRLNVVSTCVSLTRFPQILVATPSSYYPISGLETREEAEVNINLDLGQSLTLPALPNTLPCGHITSALHGVLEGTLATCQHQDKLASPSDPDRHPANRCHSLPLTSHPRRCLLSATPGTQLPSSCAQPLLDRHCFPSPLRHTLCRLVFEVDAIF